MANLDYGGLCALLACCPGVALFSVATVLHADISN